MEEEISFYGHRNVRSLHQRTFEITREHALTLRGDCIIGVSANKACNQLNDRIKKKIRNDSTRIIFEILVGDYVFTSTGMGNSNLTVSHDYDVVIRKSNYIDSRTLSVLCDKSSSDVPRAIVQLLKDPKTKGLMKIILE